MAAINTDKPVFSAEARKLLADHAGYSNKQIDAIQDARVCMRDFEATFETIKQLNEGNSEQLASMIELIYVVNGISEAAEENEINTIRKHADTLANHGNALVAQTIAVTHEEWPDNGSALGKLISKGVAGRQSSPEQARDKSNPNHQHMPPGFRARVAESQDATRNALKYPQAPIPGM
ncbi:MAG: hypothetical protein MK052_10420 [Alphaproteobacteria bacterium]|nr:hypothetical protein [Alphaproteobacteria bacterium]